MKLVPASTVLVFLPGTGLGSNFGVGPPQIKIFDVFYDAPVATGQQPILLKWAPYPEADVVSYTVLRSIIGFTAPKLTPGALAGLTLQLKVDGGATQTVAFNGVDDAITAINTTIVGGRAYPSLAVPTNFIFRSNTHQDPGSVEIVGGTALAALGLSTRVITELSEHFSLGDLPAGVDPNEYVEFEDPDGTIHDFYALITTDHLQNNSLKTVFKQAITDTGDVCVIEGIVTDLKGVRIPDARVVAKIVIPPFSAVVASFATIAEVETLSASDGRFSIVLLQGATVRLEIAAIGLGREILVPLQAFAVLSDLLVDLDVKFSDRTF